MCFCLESQPPAFKLYTSNCVLWRKDCLFCSVGLSGKEAPQTKLLLFLKFQRKKEKNTERKRETIFRR